MWALFAQTLFALLSPPINGIFQQEEIQKQRKKPQRQESLDSSVSSNVFSPTDEFRNFLPSTDENTFPACSKDKQSIPVRNPRTSSEPTISKEKIKEMSRKMSCNFEPGSSCCSTTLKCHNKAVTETKKHFGRISSVSERDEEYDESEEQSDDIYDMAEIAEGNVLN